MKNNIFLILLACLTFQANATEVQPKTATVVNEALTEQGYFAFNFGEYKVIALRDGSIDLKGSLFNKNLSSEELQQVFAKANLSQSQYLPTSVNAFLIDDRHGNLTLVDNGAGSCMGDKLGAMATNIQAAGYKLSHINSIMLTHLHLDHVCGLTQNNVAVFPLATVYVSEPELAFWSAEQVPQSVAEDKRANYQATAAQIKAVLAPYELSKSLRTFKAGSDINGIEVIQSAGHTPGHYSYLLKSQNKALVFVGDIVHSHTLQFIEPKLSVDFDTDPVQASHTRESLFAQYAQTHTWIAAPHLPFPGVGEIVELSTGHYEWKPLGSPATPATPATTSMQPTVQTVVETSAVNTQEPEQGALVTPTAKVQEANAEHQLERRLDEAYVENPSADVVTAEIGTTVKPVIEQVVEVAQNTTSTVQPK